MTELPEHVQRNRAVWDVWAKTYAGPAEADWAQATPTWGIWSVPESEVGMLSEPLDGKDAIELGCGTAYVGAWMARRGARVVGIDNSQAQLATAHRMQQQHGLSFPLLPEPVRAARGRAGGERTTAATSLRTAPDRVAGQ